MLFFLRMLGINARFDELMEIGEENMTIISEFAASQKIYNDKIEEALQGLADDIKYLTAKIEEFQNAPGSISPQDQALLNELDKRTKLIAEKMEALNELTPPEAPPAEVPPEVPVETPPEPDSSWPLEG